MAMAPGGFQLLLEEQHLQLGLQWHMMLEED